MSDSMRNRPDNSQDNQSRLSEEGLNESKSYEGFEGMNYEQVRQPYNPQQRKESRRKNKNGHGDSGSPEKF